MYIVQELIGMDNPHNKSWLNKYISKQAQSADKIWYHGTDSKNIQSIMSHGLTSSSGGAGPGQFTGPALGSLSGVYLTKDIRVAIDSVLLGDESKGDPEEVAIVICEVVSDSLVADEDMLPQETHLVSNDRKEIADLYIASKLAPFTMDAYKNEYVHRVQNEIVADFQNKLSPEILNSLSQLIKDNWQTALNRQAAYLSEYDIKRSIDAVSPAQGIEITPPSQGEAEGNFKNYQEQLTRLLKMYHQESFAEEARSTDDIGFEGPNRIVAIVSMQSVNDPQVVYGEAPNKFYDDLNNFKEILKQNKARRG